jgi:hypothetical protein
MRAGCTAMTQRPQERHTALRRLPRGAIHHGMQPALQRTNIQDRFAESDKLAAAAPAAARYITE